MSNQNCRPYLVEQSSTSGPHKCLSFHATTSQALDLGGIESIEDGVSPAALTVALTRPLGVLLRLWPRAENLRGRKLTLSLTGGGHCQRTVPRVVPRRTPSRRLIRKIDYVTL